MSIRVVTLVWENFPQGGSALLVMLALADWCDDEGGRLHPSIAVLARKVRLSGKQARRIVHDLVREGYVAVVGNAFGGRPGEARQYRLNVAKLAEAGGEAPLGVSAPLDVSTPVSVPEVSHGGAARRPLGGSLTVSEPLLEPSESEGEGFERAMGLYPERAGDNSRSAARRAWDTRLRQGCSVEEMVEGVVRYAAFVRAMGWEGTRFVKQAVTFFGPGLFFRERYALGRAVPFDPLAYVNGSCEVGGRVLDGEAWR